MAAFASSSLRATPYVYLDLETTGCANGAAVTSPFHRIVQLSAVVGRPGPADLEFDAVVDPGVHVPSASAAIHGLDDAALVNAPTFDVVWPAFVAWVHHALGRDDNGNDAATGAAATPVTFVAHNMHGFDAVVLHREIARCDAGPVPPHFVFADTLVPLRTNLATFGVPDPDDPSPASLGSWYRRVTGGQAIPNAHNALADVRALRTAVETTGLVPATAPTFVDDDAPLTALRYVKATRALRLYDFMRATRALASAAAGDGATHVGRGADGADRDADAKTVGPLRAYVRSRAATPAAQAYVLERILRDEANVFDDSQCSDIVAQVLRVPPSKRGHVAYPYLKWPFPGALYPNEHTALRRAGVHTRGALRDAFLFTCAENEDLFAAWIREHAKCSDRRARRRHWRA
jgi:DNA polymerase III epsilon subunit-like protein